MSSNIILCPAVTCSDFANALRIYWQFLRFFSFPDFFWGGGGNFFLKLRFTLVWHKLMQRLQRELDTCCIRSCHRTVLFMFIYKSLNKVPFGNNYRRFMYFWQSNNQNYTSCCCCCCCRSCRWSCSILKMNVYVHVIMTCTIYSLKKVLGITYINTMPINLFKKHTLQLVSEPY